MRGSTLEERTSIRPRSQGGQALNLVYWWEVPRCDGESWLDSVEKTRLTLWGRGTILVRLTMPYGPGSDAALDAFSRELLPVLNAWKHVGRTNVNPSEIGGRAGAEPRLLVGSAQMRRRVVARLGREDSAYTLGPRHDSRASDNALWTRERCSAGRIFARIAACSECVEARWKNERQSV